MAPPSQATQAPNSAPPAASSAGQSVVEQAIAKNAQATPAEAPVISEQPAYTPNFKFKAADKELEFDEFVRGAIKDEASEKKLREIYEKAYGIDFVKQQRDKFRTEFQTYKQQWDPVAQDLDKLGAYIKNGDYLRAMTSLGIPEEKIIEAVKNRLEYLQLPHEQRAKMDAQMQAQERAYALEQENKLLRQQYTDVASQSLSHAFDQTMARSEVKSFAEQYDARTGQPGAFEQEFLRFGDYLEKRDGKLYHPDYVAKEFMRLAGYQPESQPKMQQVAGATVVQQATQAPPVVVESPKEKPTIKNVQGKSSGVVKKSFKSLDELREKYKQTIGAN